MSESAVSRHVQDVEAMFKETLLDRTSERGATATTAGNHAYKYASLLDQLDKLLGGSGKANLQAPLQSAVCSIGVHPFIAEKRLPPIIEEFVGQRPKTEIDLRTGRTSEIVKLVRENEVDLGFVLVAMNEKIDGLNAESVGSERLGIFAVPTHPLANRVDVSCAEVSEYSFVTPGGGNRVDDKRILLLLSRMGSGEVRSAGEPPAGTIWYGLSGDSPNLCLAISGRVEVELARGELVEIDIDAAPIFYDVQMIWRDEWNLPTASHAFLAFARSQHD